MSPIVIAANAHTIVLLVRWAETERRWKSMAARAVSASRAAGPRAGRGARRSPFRASPRARGSARYEIRLNVQILRIVSPRAKLPRGRRSPGAGQNRTAGPRLASRAGCADATRLRELVELGQVLVRDPLGRPGRGGRLEQLAQLVQLDQPVLGSGPDDGPLVHFQRHDAVRRQPLQSLHDRRAAQAQLLGDLRALKLGAGRQFAADDLQQNLLIDLVHARSIGRRFGWLRRVDGECRT